MAIRSYLTDAKWKTGAVIPFAHQKIFVLSTSDPFKYPQISSHRSLTFQSGIMRDD